MRDWYRINRPWGKRTEVSKKTFSNCGKASAAFFHCSSFGRIRFKSCDPVSSDILLKRSK